MDTRPASVVPTFLGQIPIRGYKKDCPSGFPEKRIVKRGSQSNRLSVPSEEWADTILLCKNPPSMYARIPFWRGTKTHTSIYIYTHTCTRALARERS